MYKKILLNRKLSLKERIKRVVAYFLIRRGARIQWSNRFRKVIELNPELASHVKKSIEKDHKSYWKPFSSDINLLTIRVSNSISGIADPKYIPEEIFMSDIEPTINNNPAVEYLTYKSFYSRWFPGDIFPFNYFHNVDGEWLNHDLQHISFDHIKTIAQGLPYPVVFKPNRESHGGKNIYFLQHYDQLIKIIANKKDFLVQEKILQDSFFEKFNYRGLNTIRVNIYRSVKDNKPHIINLALRMGVGGSLDNETDGGIVVMIRKDGFLNGFAVDKYGNRFIKHPDTEVGFNEKIPDFGNLKSLSLDIAQKIFYTRLISLDLCYDVDKRWRMIEVNIFGSTIRFAQYHGALFFDEFTDEVFEHCLHNHWALK